MNLTALLAVASGSALGGVLRFLTSTIVQSRAGTVIPAGTLVVNVSGSFVLGAIARYWVVNPHASSTTRIFLVAGLCGGFTTFSSFSLENIELIQKGELGRALLYIVLSVVLSLTATGLGYSVVRAHG